MDANRTFAPRALRTALVLGLAAAFGTGTAMAQDALTKPQVRAKLEAQGYTRINDIQFDDGTWTADARSADGNRVELRMDARTGEVFPDELVGHLSKDDVKAQLAAAGWSNVHDIDWDDGVWKAEADDEDGRDFEVRLDPKTGKIIGTEKD
jgi:hypothetical protein